MNQKDVDETKREIKDWINDDKQINILEMSPSKLVAEKGFFESYKEKLRSLKEGSEEEIWEQFLKSLDSNEYDDEYRRLNPSERKRYKQKILSDYKKYKNIKQLDHDDAMLYSQESYKESIDNEIKKLFNMGLQVDAIVTRLKDKYSSMDISVIRDKVEKVFRDMNVKEESYKEALTLEDIKRKLAIANEKSLNTPREYAFRMENDMDYRNIMNYLDKNGMNREINYNEQDKILYIPKKFFEKYSERLKKMRIKEFSGTIEVNGKEIDAEISGSRSKAIDIKTGEEYIKVNNKWKKKESVKDLYKDIDYINQDNMNYNLKSGSAKRNSDDTISYAGFKWEFDKLLRSGYRKIESMKEYNSSGLKNEYNKLLEQKDDLTTSDLQGTVMAMVNKAFPELNDMSDRDKRMKKSQIEDIILDGINNGKDFSNVEREIKNIHKESYKEKLQKMKEAEDNWSNRVVKFEMIEDTRDGNKNAKSNVERMSKEVLRKLDDKNKFKVKAGQMRDVEFDDPDEGKFISYRIPFWVKINKNNTKWNEVYALVNQVKAVPYKFI